MKPENFHWLPFPWPSQASVQVSLKPRPFYRYLTWSKRQRHVGLRRLFALALLVLWFWGVPQVGMLGPQAKRGEAASRSLGVRLCSTIPGRPPTNRVWEGIADRKDKQTRH